MIDDEAEEPKLKTDTKEDRSEFLATARKRFEDSVSDEKGIREQALLDLRFVVGDQWAADVKNERVSKGRPALTFNRCHTFVQNVSNEARQNKPQIKFIVADGGDKDTAEVKEGIARHIQYSSDAQVAYETAVEYSAGGSFGYFGFITDYVNPSDEKDWNQEVKVRPFYDPFAIYGILIPSCFGMEPQYGFVVEEIPVSEYKRLYDTDEIDAVGWDLAAKQSQGWIGTETVRVAEYWYLEHEDKEISRKNPDTDKEETRTVDKCTVRVCKTNGLEVIKGTDTLWPGYCIPIVPVLGKQIIVDGKPNLFSVVRFQRDPQQLINFYKTRIAETLGTQPIQPYVMYEGQMQGHEKEWAESNSTMRPTLLIKAVQGPDGQTLPAPQRQVLEPPIASLSEAASQEIDDMKATAGIYDASLGSNRNNEVSGSAIQKRQQQSNVTNMHFMDNLERAFKKGGLIIADIMPKIYDAKRMVRILGKDEAPKIVKINQEHQDESGNTKHYKIGETDSDKQDVVVTMGRAFSTKRQESFDMMTSVLQTSPNLIQMIGDIFFANSDLAGADQLSERFKKMLPPNLQSQDQNDPAAQAQQLQGQLQQAQQHNQALNAYAQKLEKEHDGKVVEQQAKVQIVQMQEMSRQEIVKMQEATKLAVAQINASKDVHETIAQQEMQAFDLMHSAAHEQATQAVQHGHEQDMAQQQAAVAQQQQQSQQDAAAQSQQSDQEHQAGMAQQAQDNQPAQQ